MIGEASQYKEKFHALREKFDHVTAIHRDHENELEAAQSKLKNLQAECDMLLDNIAMYEPYLTQYVDREQPPSYTSAPPHGLNPDPVPHMTAANGVSVRAHHVPANGHAHEPDSQQHVSRQDPR